MSDPPDLALDLINDALEYHSHLIVNGLEDGDIIQHWDSLRYFFKISSDQQFNFGRIYHRCRLAELVYYGCYLRPYGSLEKNNSNNKPQRRRISQHHESMVSWDRTEWDGLHKKIMKLFHSCKRKDANVLITSYEDENSEDHERAQDSALFGKRLKHLLEHIHINKTLSLFRTELEQAILADKEAEVDVHDLREFWEEIEGISDQKKYKFLKQFLAPGSTAEEPRLQPIQDIKSILKNKPCNLEVLQADILCIVMSWNKALFKNGAPALARLGYGDLGAEVTHAVYDNGENEDDQNPHQNDDDEEDVDDRKPAAKSSPEQVRDMRRARANLHQSARDPLPEAYETARRLPGRRVKNEEGVPHVDATADDENAASRAQKKPTVVQYDDSTSEITAQSSHNRRRNKRDKRRRRRQDDDSEITDPSGKGHGDDTPTRKRKKKSRLRFDDDDDDDDDEVKSVRISELPDFHQRSPARNNNNGSRRPKKRKFWTEEEKDAVRRGVQEYGVGKWKEILNAFPEVLKNRSNVQIKDCYRTLMKNKEE